MPGLINSVRWKSSQIKAIVQRSYSREIPAAGTITPHDLPDEEAAHSAPAMNFIQHVIENLKNYGFKPPKQSTSLTQQRLRFEFDLGHHRHAAILRKNSLLREGELQRVLEVLHKCPEQRLLLEGMSGSGKSVFMAQMFHNLANQAIYLSFDCQIEPMEEVVTKEQQQAIQTIAVPVRMHYLTILCELTGTNPPSRILDSGAVQSHIKSLLKKLARKEGSFYILIDGLNQTNEPTAPFFSLPDPLPSNLFILVATQPQEHIRKQVSSFGRKQWTRLTLETLLLDEAGPLINRS